MNDLEVLGIEECDKSLFPSHLDELTKDEELELKCAELNRKHYFNSFYSGISNNIKLNCSYYIVSYEPKNTSNLGCGYTKFLYITANNINDVTNYCLDRFGEIVTIKCQHGSVDFDSYNIKGVTPQYYLNELRHRKFDVEHYNNIEDVVEESYCYKTYICHSGPYHIKNGVIVSDNEGQRMTIFKPYEFEEINLCK